MHDHFSYRYEVLSLLGKGSFGQVAKCFDYKENAITAVKLIRNKKRFHHQALVEVKLLQYVKERDTHDQANVVHMGEYFYFRNHLCITFEVLSINLYELIKNNNFQGLSLGLIRRFAVQLLTSLRAMRKLRIIHCDLKPENILLRQPNKSGIKIIDFGSSCFEDERVYTYIQSRFYRSPEVILGLPYDTGIDMWSFGCILAELYTGYPLFPGENEMEQLACVMEVFGTPPQSLVDLSNRKNMFFDSNNEPRIVANSRGKKRRPDSRELAAALNCSDAGFNSFLAGTLAWDPRERFTPETAIQHEWILEGLQGHHPPRSSRVVDRVEKAAKEAGRALPSISKPKAASGSSTAR
jgi:dual specificity tyrosine-phosphorylation-regulated kinase 2/3/4